MDKSNTFPNKVKYSRYYTYIKPVIQNPIVRSFAPSIFSLITITVLTVFVLRPTVATILSLQKSAADNRKVLETLEKKAQDLTLGRKNLDAIDEQTKSKISGLLPITPSVVSLIATMRNNAEASISAIQVQPLTLYSSSAPPAGLSADEIAFSLNMQGSFTQILTTLNNFSKSSRLIKIENINIGKKDGPIVLSASAKAFYLK